MELKHYGTEMKMKRKRNGKETRTERYGYEGTSFSVLKYIQPIEIWSGFFKKYKVLYFLCSCIVCRLIPFSTVTNPFLARSLSVSYLFLTNVLSCSLHVPHPFFARSFPFLTLPVFVLVSILVPVFIPDLEPITDSDLVPLLVPVPIPVFFPVLVSNPVHFLFTNLVSVFVQATVIISSF